MQTWNLTTIDGASEMGAPVTYNPDIQMTIDWGDGSSTNVASPDDLVHTYATPGKYQVTIGCDDWSKAHLAKSTIVAAPSPIAEARANTAQIGPIPRVANSKFNYLFYRYERLDHLPEALFANNPQITSFLYAFNGCTSLEAIPEALFANNPQVTSFHFTFGNCVNIREIPPSLFKANEKVTAFNNVFFNCRHLEFIPEALFANNHMAETFQMAFAYCTNLKAVPEFLFCPVPKATEFSYVFCGCTELKTVPANVFGAPRRPKNFFCAFDGCTKLRDTTIWMHPEHVEDVECFMRNTGPNNAVWVPRDCHNEPSPTELLFREANDIGCTITTNLTGTTNG